jgi:hypothetical protein
VRDEDCALHGVTIGSPAWDARVDQIIAHVRAKIADPEVGWMGMGIGEDKRHKIAGFSYTIGLEQNWGQREIFVMGLPHAIGHSILGRVVSLVKGGSRFVAGDTSDEIAEGFGARFKGTDKGWLVSFGVARRYYGRDVCYLQLVWPDPQGIFPGDPGCDPRMARIQAVG